MLYFTLYYQPMSKVFHLQIGGHSYTVLHHEWGFCTRHKILKKKWKAGKDMLETQFKFADHLVKRQNHVCPLWSCHWRYWFHSIILASPVAFFITFQHLSSFHSSITWCILHHLSALLYLEHHLVNSLSPFCIFVPFTLPSPGEVFITFLHLCSFHSSTTWCIIHHLSASLFLSQQKPATKIAPELTDLEILQSKLCIFFFNRTKFFCLVIYP